MILNLKLMSRLISNCLVIFMIVPSVCFANSNTSDTLQMSMQQAEKLVVEKNLSLLAARYSVDAQQALIQQAKYWDNPMLNTDQNIYDGKFFRHNSNGGQVFVQIMQLIQTAGKRHKAAQLAMDNTTLSSQQFDDLMRTLRFSLRNNLEQTDYLLSVKAVYQNEIHEVEKLAQGMDLAYQSGDIALKDNMRIKALLFGLQNDLSHIDIQLIDLQKDIRILLQTKDQVFVKPTVSYHVNDLTKINAPSLDSLMQVAAEWRTDFKIANTQLAYQEHNLIYQKALAKPDISAGIEYDRLSSYTPNYVGLALSVPLPVFNRNQGNIRSASFAVRAQEALRDQVKNSFQNEVQSAYKKLLYYQHLNNEDQVKFSVGYHSLFENMITSYKERQISLLEFIDFLDAYKDTQLKLADQQNNLVRSVEELNYTVGKDLIKLN